MTVAHIRECADSDLVEVLFLESPRVHEVRKAHPDADEILERLRTAGARNQRVQVRLASPDSDWIVDVRLA